MFDAIQVYAPRMIGLGTVRFPFERGQKPWENAADHGEGVEISYLGSYYGKPNTAVHSEDCRPLMIEVPVIAAVTSPFTTIILDDSDAFNTTFDDVNNLTYDRLKICRTTMAIDGGLSCLGGPAINAAALLTATGAILYPRFKGVDHAFVLNSSNNILFKMLLGGIEFDAVSPDDIGYGQVFQTGYFMLSGGAGGPNYDFLMSLQQGAVSNFHAIKLLKPRTFTKTQISEAISKGGIYTNMLPEINPSLFLDGLTHLRRRQLPSALIFLWSTAEFLLARMWEDRIVPQGAGIEGRKRFVESNQWQGAQRAEVLFQVGAISADVYGKLNRARTARNALAHRGTSPDETVCVDSLDVALTLMSSIASSYSSTSLFGHVSDPFRPNDLRERPHTVSG